MVYSLTLLILAFPAGPRRPVLAHWVHRHDDAPLRAWREDFENPDFVVYDDGLVVFRPTADSELREARVTESEMTAILGVSAKAFFELPEKISGTRRLDAPVHLVTRWRGTNRKTVRFFGSLHEEADRGQAPASLLKVLDAVMNFRPMNAKPWEPEVAVLRACRTKKGHSKADSTNSWPTAWRSPEHGEVLPLLTGCYQHRLKASDRTRAEALVRSPEGFGVVMHQGAPWLVSLVRFAFPSEDMWDGR